jgi:glutamate/aspartate transport system substrate-binding protein
VPFSSTSKGGPPQGYSIDLCLAIVEDLSAAIGGKPLKVEYRRVTPTDRMEQVGRGHVDLECGSTTITQERRSRVAFSPVIFIAGTRLLVQRGSPVRSIRDLAGRKVVVVRGTSNEAAMRRWASDARHRLQLEVADDYEEALSRVSSGQAAALAADDALLAGYIAERRLQRVYTIVGELLSYEPYGIMYAKNDEDMGSVVHATLVRLATSGEIRSLYSKWFMRPLPSGVQLRWPMSMELARTFELLGMPPE